MLKYQVTKPSKKDPGSLRIIKSFKTLDQAIEWASVMMFENDHRFFIDDSNGHRYATVTYDADGPVVESTV